MDSTIFHNVAGSVEQAQTAAQQNSRLAAGVRGVEDQLSKNSHLGTLQSFEIPHVRVLKAGSPSKARWFRCPLYRAGSSIRGLLQYRQANDLMC